VLVSCTGCRVLVFFIVVVVGSRALVGCRVLVSPTLLIATKLVGCMLLIAMTRLVGGVDKPLVVVAWLGKPLVVVAWLGKPLAEVAWLGKPLVRGWAEVVGATYSPLRVTTGTPVQ